jgi:hypothetical protein
MASHILKIDSFFFDAVKRREKTAEVRFNDRNYQLGDTLIIYPVDSDFNRVGLDECWRVITHIVHGGQYGIESGYCLLSMN